MVTSSYASSKQAGNGATLAFSGAFKILANTDLVVSKLDAAGVSSGTLILGTDYTVTSFDPIAETWTVTFTVAPVSGGFAVVTRASSVTQETSLPREGNAPAKTLETMFDRLTLIMQELQALGFQTPLEGSGVYASKPAAPTVAMYYYSTDKGLYEKWVPAMSAWITIGGLP